MSCPMLARVCAMPHIAKVPVFVLLFAVVLLSAPGATRAQTLDLSLNVLYNDPNNSASGGVWQLVGKSSGFGIAGVNALVTGISESSVVNRAPLGTVNVSDAAGFFTFQAATNPLGYVNIIAAQAPVLPGAGEEEALFYGVGTLANGAPNYPGKPAGTNAIGPLFSSLTNVQNGVWANTLDPLGDAAWNTAAILASGEFLAGVNPGLYAAGETRSRGSIFTSLGTSSDFGTINTNPTVTSIVRRNLLVLLGGDYNENGIVDAADYTVWRDTLGTSVPAGTGADGNIDGVINTGDYDVWKANFGAMIGSGSGGPGLGAGRAVPEPASAALVALAALVAASACGRKRPVDSKGI